MTTKKTAVPVLKFNPKEEGLARWLGPTETMIMSIIWDANRPMTVKQVLHALITDYEHNISYTAVMTTMGRMFEKGLLTRVKSGFAYVYTPKCSQDAFVDIQIAAIVDSIGLDIVAEFVQQAAQ